MVWKTKDNIPLLSAPEHFQGIPFQAFIRAHLWTSGAEERVGILKRSRVQENGKYSREGYLQTNKGKIASKQDSLLLALLVPQTVHEVLQKKEEVTASNDYKALPSIKIDAGRLN